MTNIELHGEGFTLAQMSILAEAWATPAEATISISDGAAEKVRRARQAIEDIVEEGHIVYGVTTGFGDFKDRIIPPHQVQQLQRNIVVSHAVGVGPILKPRTVRAMMIIRIAALLKGHSGIRLEVVDALAQMVNKGVYPVIPAQGSLGASGDLAPLAHMALVLIGEGEAFYQGERLPGAEAMQRAGIPTFSLEAKEGLALTNGTSLICAAGGLAAELARDLTRVADLAAAMSMEALRGTLLAFDPRIHAARPHTGQGQSAAFIRELLAGSDLIREFDPLDVQDAYSLRCTPQVHGAGRDVINFAREKLGIELNSANDNPLIFFDEAGSATVLSGGNFHGEPVAIPLDAMKIGVAELGSISERRLARLVDEKVNKGLLPAFLTHEGGLNSGFMLVQYTAAALVSENKVLCHPASVDSIPSSANTEDHVSMGPIAARHAYEIAENVEKILALELFAAAQGIDFRLRAMAGEPRLGAGTRHAYALIREHVPFLEADAVMAQHIETVVALVRSGQLLAAVEGA